MKKKFKDNDVWYTRPEEIREAMEITNRLIAPEYRFDMFDLDPCAAYHRETPFCKDSKWLGKPEAPWGPWDGLEHWWFGHVFVNPPFSNIADWCTSAWADSAGVESISMIIPNTKLEQKTVNRMMKLVSDQEHTVSALTPLERRRPFIHPKTLEEMKSPRFGICVWSIVSSSIALPSLLHKQQSHQE